MSTTFYKRVRKGDVCYIRVRVADAMVSAFPGERTDMAMVQAIGTDRQPITGDTLYVSQKELITPAEMSALLKGATGGPR